MNDAEVERYNYYLTKVMDYFCLKTFLMRKPDGKKEKPLIVRIAKIEAQNTQENATIKQQFVVF